MYKIKVIITTPNGEEILEADRFFGSLDEARDLDVNNLINNAEYNEKDMGLQGTFLSQEDYEFNKEDLI